MTILRQTIAGSISLLLIPFSAAVYGLESGSLTPRKPNYQLPQLPPLQKTPLKDNIQLHIPDPKESPITRIEPRFMLKTLHFKGNKSLSDEQLLQAVNAFINKKVNRIELETIRQQLIEVYRQAGYLYPSVLLPSQHISQGLVTYEINEGHLTHINISGAERLNENYIRERINLDPEEPIQQTELLERFQLLLADPLIERVNGTLKPGIKPGDTILDLDVTRAQAYELHLAMDNYTPPSVGSYTGHLSGTVRNLTGQGDFLQLDLNGSEGMQSVGSFFSIPFTRYDTRFNLGFQAAQSKVVDANLAHLKIKNQFVDVNVGINQPIFRRLNHIFNVELQYAFRQTDTSVLGIPMPLSAGVGEDGKATINVFRFIQNYITRNTEHVLSLRSSFNVGFDGFNATTHSGAIPDGRYFSWQGQVHYLRQLDERGTEFFFRTDMQFTSEALLPLERFALGGVHTIRGYREYELVRDEGYAMSIEIRYPLWKPAVMKDHQLRVVPFFDFGQAWNKHQDAKTLYSAGIGLKWQWQQFEADFYWAKALNNINNAAQEYDAQDSGIHFQLQAQIL